MGLRRVLGVGLVAGALVAPWLAPTSTGVAGAAAAGGSVDAQLDELQESLDDVAAEEQALQADLERTQRERTRLDAELASLDEQVAGARAELDGARTRLDAAMAEHLHTRDRLEHTQLQLARSRRRVRDQAITAYVTMGSPSAVPHLPIRLVDPADASRARVLGSVVVDAQGDVIERHRDLRQRAEELEAFAVAARARAAEHEDRVAGRTEAVERLHEALTATREEVAAEAERETALLAETQRRKAEYEQRIAALKAESDSLSSELRQRQSTQVVLTAGKGQLGLPLLEPRITSKFGYRIHPIYKTRRLHAGTDFGASSGTPILAAADGTVVTAGVRGGYGNTVVIDHGGSLATLYAHQSRIAASVGQTVVRGQVIGYVGSTGNSTGPHLHFEVRVSGTPVDPMGYL